jgi:hypothetical protein
MYAITVQKSNTKDLVFRLCKIHKIVDLNSEKWARS